MDTSVVVVVFAVCFSGGGNSGSVGVFDLIFLTMIITMFNNDNEDEEIERERKREWEKRQK